MKKLFTFLLSAILVFCISVHSYAQIITTIAGGGTGGGTGGLGDGGPAIDAVLGKPYGIAVDGEGNIYFADRNNNRLRMINAAGIITTIAGTGSASFSGDGGPATDAKVNAPYGVAFDVTGNVYFVDGGNARIRKINTAGIITTIAGKGVVGYSGENALATDAEMNGPNGIAVDSNGNIYFCDSYNNRIRKISVTGVISTFAGTGVEGHSGDGAPATAANLANPYGISLDNSGNMFFTEGVGNTVRKINATGIISTIAGNGSAGFSGDNGPATLAEFHLPVAVAVDAMGNLYIVDGLNYRIRKINLSGEISTYAGDGSSGFGGDGGLASLAKLGPSGVAIDKNGNLYISDLNNNRIRFIKSTVSVDNLMHSPENLLVYPNPAHENVTITVSSTTRELAHIAITNIAGETLKEFSAVTNEPLKLKLDERSGLYFIVASTSHGMLSTRLVLSQ